MSNVCEKAYGFTALTPMKPWKTPFLRAFLGLVPILSTPLAQRLLWWFPLAQDQKRLLDLSFIHFARWSVIRHNRWPWLAGGQRRDRTRYDYLLFASNFNGSWEQYIDAFSEEIPGGMNGIWRWSEKFPGAQPISPFLTYIRQVQIDNDYYYGAYPGATANDVKCALHLAEALEAFTAKTKDMGAEAFAAEYRRFLVSVQNCLGSTGNAPVIVDWEEEMMPVSLPHVDRVPAGLELPEGVEVSTAIATSA
jgi:hypothetical protein